MKQLNEHDIHQASVNWTWKREKSFAPDEVVLCTINSIVKISSVWTNDRGWIDRSSKEKFSPNTESLMGNGWNIDQPAIVGLAANGLVTLLDGNHRLTTVLFTEGLYERIPYVPVKFHFFNVGDPINPIAPERKWDGSNLIFLCYPRGTCGKCAGCKNTLPEVRERLARLNIN